MDELDDSLIADFPTATLRSVSVSKMDNNVYLLTSKDTGTQILIDAAAGIRKIRRMLEAAAADASEVTSLDLVVTTHSHWDHIRALRELVDDTGVRTASGRADAAGIEGQTGVRMDDLLDDGGTVDVNGLSLDVIGLVGHTPGSVALVYRPVTGPVHIFSGDSLFPGGIGNTHNDPAAFGSLIDDVEHKIFDVYGDDTVVHPGHGDSTTLGDERPHLVEWRARGW